MIEISGLHKAYRDIRAVDGVDLTVREGEIFGVLGRSGAGKSTLLRCVNLLERPDAGRVVVDGVDLTALPGARLREARRGLGMIHQHFALLASRTAAGNVSYPLEVIGTPRAERRRRVAELLELVGLGDRAEAYPAQLSGGQKQRVGIARALAAGPKVLLSDEATSALDPETTSSVLDLLLDLNRRLGLTILLITHEMDVVKRICHSAAVMRAGRFTESGSLAELLRDPGSELARGLFPLSGGEARPGETLLDVTVSGEVAEAPVLSALSRALDVDVRLVDGGVQHLAVTRAGRLRLGVPGDAAKATAFLRERGALVTEVGPMTAPANPMTAPTKAEVAR